MLNNVTHGVLTGGNIGLRGDDFFGGLGLHCFGASRLITFHLGEGHVKKCLNVNHHKPSLRATGKVMEMMLGKEMSSMRISLTPGLMNMCIGLGGRCESP